MNLEATTSPIADAPAGGSGQMFDRIAARYDLLNRLISFGVDQSWRRRTVTSLRTSAGPATILDVAAGTADLSILIAETLRAASVIGLDPSANMLSVGAAKLAARGLSERVTLVEGSAEALPFDDASFDGVTIAFGIRNVPDRLLGLREMARVTRPVGRVCVLELSEPPGGVLGSMARFHVHRVVPWLGGVLSGDREYRYLQQSIAAFPPPQQFARMLDESGLDVLEVHPLTFGVCHLYVSTPRA